MQVVDKVRMMGFNEQFMPMPLDMKCSNCDDINNSITDFISNIEMAEDKMYVAVNQPSESMTIEYIGKSNTYYSF